MAVKKKVGAGGEPQVRVERIVMPAIRKHKGYKFLVLVKRAYTRREAEMAVLKCFAMRQPDSFEFHLRRMPKQA
jgi:hypothetical protein